MSTMLSRFGEVTTILLKNYKRNLRKQSIKLTNLFQDFKNLSNEKEPTQEKLVCYAIKHVVPLVQVFSIDIGLEDHTNLVKFVLVIDRSW